ncbi:MAG: isoprenoid biosynthesis glyoxalase ElbB, partial [Desulfatiglandales bacterium]
VLTLYFLKRYGADYLCMAPNIEQYHVINHLTQQETDEKRNVLVESARIARGEIRDIKDVKAEDIDALILPGGFGAAKNLSDFAFKGDGARVQPEVERLLKEMVNHKKPIGAICIAPATVTKALEGMAPEITIGQDIQTASLLEKMGAKHHFCRVDEVWVDLKRKLVTTPAYMLGPSILDVAQGIERLVREVLALTRV